MQRHATSTVTSETWPVVQGSSALVPQAVISDYQEQADLFPKSLSPLKKEEAESSDSKWTRLLTTLTNLFKIKTFRGNSGPFVTIPESCLHMAPEYIRERQRQLTRCFHIALERLEGVLGEHPKGQFESLRIQEKLTFEVGLLHYFASVAYLAFSSATRFNKSKCEAALWAPVFDIESLDKCRGDGGWIKTAADEIRSFGLLLRFNIPRSEKPVFKADRLGEIDAGYMTHVPAVKLAALGTEAMAVKVLLDGRWQRCTAKNEARWKPAQRFVQEGLEELFTLPDATDPGAVLRALEGVYRRTHNLE